MGEMMNLLEAVSQLSNLNEDMTIYASKPWNEASEVVVQFEPEEGGLPEEAQAKSLYYFLEVFVAKEFLDGWVSSQETVPSMLDMCRRLIEYAINDA